MANLLACNCKYRMAGRLIRTRRGPQLGKTKQRINMCKASPQHVLKQLSNEAGGVARLRTIGGGA